MHMHQACYLLSTMPATLVEQKNTKKFKNMLTDIFFFLQNKKLTLVWPTICQSNIDHNFFWYVFTVVLHRNKTGRISKMGLFFMLKRFLFKVRLISQIMIENTRTRKNIYNFFVFTQQKYSRKLQKMNFLIQSSKT